MIRTLQLGGIELTSLHNHPLAEAPRLYFMHVWAKDNAIALARAIRSALDKTNPKRPAPERC